MQDCLGFMFQKKKCIGQLKLISPCRLSFQTNLEQIKGENQTDEKDDMISNLIAVQIITLLVVFVLI